ncbi:MAG TPA: hypothetical protein VF403_12125 [Kofleriaceae bacterium]
MRRFLWVVLFAGCTQSPADRIEIVCNTFCDCVSTLPSAVETCVTQQCEPTIPPVSDECLACVYDHESTCGALVSDCQTMCFQQATP